MENSTFCLKKQSLHETICKSFLVFLNNFEESVREISEGILTGKTDKIAALFSPNRPETFEVVCVTDEVFNLIDVRCNLSDVKAAAKPGEKIVFKGFRLHLDSLVGITAKGDGKSVLRGIRSHFPVVLGEGVLFVDYAAVPVEKISLVDHAA